MSVDQTAPVTEHPWVEPYSGAATVQDIAACFRLLLGRNPNPEEWFGHSMRAGEDLAGVVASYLGSLEFARRGLSAADGDAEIVRTALPGFLIHSARADAAIGRHVRADNYERDVTGFFRRFLRPGMAVLDLGANIGYFALLSAAIVGPGGYVLAVEPNPANTRLLEASRRANRFDHLAVCQAAAGPGLGMLALHTDHSNGTTSPMAPDADAVLASTTVGCIPPDLLLPRGRRIDLVKVDVEGAEYNALLGCRAMLARDRPTIVSEFSPTLMPGVSGIEGEAYLRWLLGLGYALSVILEPDGALTERTRDARTVMAIWRARNKDHIDIVASPV